MSKIVIIDNYDSFTFNLYQMLQPLVTEKIAVFKNDEITFDELLAMKADKLVLSPGPGHPGNKSDFGLCEEIIKRQPDLKASILGVCLAHQGMAHHFGGTVERAPQVVHGKSSRVKIEQSTPLFDGLPEIFEAMRYHSLIALDKNFPAELKVTAREVEHGYIMALEHRERPIYGVQFHPESIGTPLGARMLENFVQKC
ncbi:MAG: aminodeoxychorismate/anthranilate synthase component II [Cyanobacteria bacterium SZAS LIN-2]|nr:aminodeoxychorismate/anthranilate synthase component II [Cyanobacteria bacterium SZAS LIN-3]MBS1998234.1 aminodeoxychorismate/anthranilate synthase component II [Cyanobacteria bacterium SZAS LIN-2]